MMKTARVKFKSGLKDDLNEKAEETNHLEKYKGRIIFDLFSGRVLTFF